MAPISGPMPTENQPQMSAFFFTASSRSAVGGGFAAASADGRWNVER